MNASSQGNRRMVASAILALIALCAFGPPACGDDDDESSSGNGEQVKVGFVMKSLTVPYWLTYVEGAKRVAADNPEVDVEYTGASSESDARGQIAKVEELLLQDIDALVIGAISDALTPVVRRAADQGVKVVLAESPLEGFDDYVTIVGANQSAAAAEGAEYILDELGSDLQKAAFLTAPGIPVVEQRGEAVREVFEKAGVEVVAEGPAPECGLPPSVSSTEDILQANPDLDLIYALCAPPDIGAIRAIEQEGLVPNKDVFVFGFDGLPEEFAAIKQGKLLGTIDQRPDLQGEAALKAAIASARGESVPKESFSKTTIVDEKNVDEAIAAIEEVSSE